MAKSNSSPLIDRASRWRAAVVGVLTSAALTPAPVQAQDNDTGSAISLQGFASAAYIQSTGNRFYGHTTGGGDVDFYEAGVQAFGSIHPSVSGAAQVLSRKAGNTDDGKARIDYAFVDWHDPAAARGVRVGRVRNPMGFYNETRDVLLTRPSTLLPQSVYFEGTGVREILFSSDALQLYANHTHDWGHTSAKLSVATSQTAADQTLANFSAGLPAGASLHLDVKSPVFAQVLHQSAEGRVRLAWSYVDLTLQGAYVAGTANTPLSIASQLHIASVQYNSDDWSLTSEYQQTRSRTVSTGYHQVNRSDGLYVQGQYFFTPRLTGLLREDMSFPNRSNRSANPFRNTTVGLTYQPTPQWQINLEHHRMRGKSGIPRADNPGGIQPNTRLWTVSVGLRF